MATHTARRAFVGTAAAATAAVTIAAPLGAATPASKLSELIATARKAATDADAYHRDVYTPADARRNAAVSAAMASLPHTTVDAGDGTVWTTANPAHTAAARMRVALAKRGMAEPVGKVAAARKLLAAHHRRNRAIDRARRSEGVASKARRSDELADATAHAQNAVAAYPVASPADLATKLAFMVERRMGDGMDWLPELLADAQRITGEIA